MSTPSFRGANRRFLRWFFPAMVIYVGICIAGPILLVLSDNPSRLLRAALALLTSAPIAVVFWLLGRHLNETDEYTRKVQVDAMLVGGAVTLSAAVLWGFLEFYRAVPKLEYFPSLMMVGPLFFAAWGIAYWVQSSKSK